MAVTDDEVRAYFAGLPPNTSDAQIASDMLRYNVPVSQVSRITGVDPAEVQSRFEASFNPSQEDIRTYTQSLPAESGPTRIVSDMARYGVTGDEVARAMGLNYDQALQAYNQAQNFKTNYTDEDILNIQNFLRANPGMSDAEIVSNMLTYGVGPAAMARATGLAMDEVQRRYDAVMAPLRPTTALNPVTPTTPTTPLGPTNVPTSPIPANLTPPNVPVELLPGNIGGAITATPPISRDFPTTATQGSQTTAPQYINPAPISVGGALVPEYTNIPGGVSPLAVPALNVRNLINQGVVPRYVTRPRDTASMQFEPIFTIGDRIF